MTSDDQQLRSASREDRRISAAPPRRGAVTGSPRRPAIGSSKNITPWRETIRSNGAPSGVARDASPCTKRSIAPAFGPAPARRRSRPRRDRGRSARAPGAASAKAKLVAPRAAADVEDAAGHSSGKARARSASFSGASVRSVRRHSPAQASPVCPCHSVAASICPEHRRGEGERHFRVPLAPAAYALL